MPDIYSDVVHLARLALAGRQQDIQMFLRRVAKQLREDRPQSATEIEKLLSKSPTRSSTPLREVEMAVPVDADSRLHLVRSEYPVELETSPIWEDRVGRALSQVVAEREHEEQLLREKLAPTKSLLFVGPPGVGKSLAAKWLTRQLDRPLLTLDLSAVMSSYLGRTGVNLRYVLDYAKTLDCILLLDEFDAVAKRRDDDAEIGELKRLVTVLLQEIDQWPTSGLLVAATNHPELLDPAVWRRFEMVVEFPMPTPDQIRVAVNRSLADRGLQPDLVEVVALALGGLSYSDVDRELRRIHRESIVANDALESRLSGFISEKLRSLSLEDRKAAAMRLLATGLSARKTHDWTGLHRKVIGNLQREHSAAT